MLKNALSILGISVAVLPFVSVPNNWKTPVYFAIGVMIAYLGYRLSNPKRKFIVGKPVAPRKMKRSNNESRYIPVSSVEETVPLSEREEEKIQ